MMYQSIFIGNKLIVLDEVDSTNLHLQTLLSEHDNKAEGLVVTARKQYAGKGQRSNRWISEANKNLTFSVFLRSNLLIQHQFLLSKTISLGIIDFLNHLGLNELKIKWPNDIYCGNNKIAGILIENSVRENKIYSSVVGVGLNVNQLNFDLSIKNPTSIAKELAKEYIDLSALLRELLFFIEKRYLTLKTGEIKQLDESYLEFLYKLNEHSKFVVNNNIVEGIIVGVHSTGKLQVNISNQTKEFDLKEIEFVN